MQLFKHFFKLLSRNRIGLVIYACITLVMTILLITTTQDQNKTEASVEKVAYKISYSDSDNSVLSRGLIDYLSEENVVSDYTDKNDTEVSNLVFFGITHFHMDIPEGFGESVAKGETDSLINYQTVAGNSSYVSYDLDSRINAYLNSYNRFLKLGFSEEEAVTKAKDLVINDSSITVVSEEQVSSVKENRELVIYNINQYFPYLILGMLSLGVGNTIIITNKKELIERNSVSPVPAFLTKFVNTLGLIIVGVVIWALFLSFSFIYGAGTELITKYGIYIALNSFASMLTCCAIASVLTNYIKTSNTLSMVTNIVSLGMAFFCGVFVPLRFIGDNVLTFAKFLPFYWTVWVNSMLSEVNSTYAFDYKSVMIGIGVEFLFAIAISAIAILGTSKSIIKE